MFEGWGEPRNYALTAGNSVCLCLSTPSGALIKNGAGAALGQQSQTFSAANPIEMLNYGAYDGNWVLTDSRLINAIIMYEIMKPVLSFVQQPSYAGPIVIASGSTIDVVVKRTGALTRGTSAATCDTSKSSAVANVDFVPISKPLNWAAGDGSDRVCSLQLLSRPASETNVTRRDIIVSLSLPAAASPPAEPYQCLQGNSSFVVPLAGCSPDPNCSRRGSCNLTRSACDCQAGFAGVACEIVVPSQTPTPTPTPAPSAPIAPSSAPSSMPAQSPGPSFTPLDQSASAGKPGDWPKRSVTLTKARNGVLVKSSTPQTTVTLGVSNEAGEFRMQATARNGSALVADGRIRFVGLVELWACCSDAYGKFTRFADLPWQPVAAPDSVPTSAGSFSSTFATDPSSGLKVTATVTFSSGDTLPEPLPLQVATTAKVKLSIANYTSGIPVGYVGPNGGLPYSYRLALLFVVESKELFFDQAIETPAFNALFPRKMAAGVAQIAPSRTATVSRYATTGLNARFLQSSLGSVSNSSREVIIARSTYSAFMAGVNASDSTTYTPNGTLPEKLYWLNIQDEDTLGIEMDFSFGVSADWDFDPTKNRARNGASGLGFLSAVLVLALACTFFP